MQLSSLRILFRVVVFLENASNMTESHYPPGNLVVTAAVIPGIVIVIVALCFAGISMVYSD